MKHPLLLLAILGVISLAMRFTDSPPTSNPAPAPNKTAIPPQKRNSAQDLDYLLGANSRPSPNPATKTSTQTVRCYFGEPLQTYTKHGPYRSSQELREDLDHPEVFGNILAAPVRRKGKLFGIRLFYKGPSPFARLGLQSGDIVKSLNHFKLNRVENFPGFLCELRSASSLHFLLERKGAIVPLDIDLP